MTHNTFRAKVEKVIESQGDETFVALALDDLHLTFIEDVPKDKQEFFLGRCAALWEEAQ